MWRPRLKPIRVAGALAVGGGLTLALLDFRSAAPAPLGHWLASVQLVPAAVALATGVGLVAAVIAGMILVGTLLVGRVYCSVVCPLGVLQDVIPRLALRRRQPRLPHAQPKNALRYGFLGLCVAGVAAGWGGLTLALLDPYSHFGRIATGLFQPLLVLANNAIVGLGERLGVPLLYRVEAPWLGWGALALPLFMLTLVGMLAVWRGRLFCNTVCPVGTLLGLMARRGAWRLTLDRAACHKCGNCLQACKAQCIDLRAGAIDVSRCVACYNCVDVCAERAIAYRFAWIAPARKLGTAAATPADLGRRTFIADATVLAVATMSMTPPPPAAAKPVPVVDDNRSGAVCPPGAGSVERYLSRCTACHLCVSACPTHVLRPALFEYGVAGMLRPRLDFNRAFCNYDCRRCGEVCPDGAIALLDLPEKHVTRIGRSVFTEDLCVVKKKGTDCSACSEHCPTKAVDPVPYRGNLRLPALKAELCIGCGACEFACPVVPEKAITVNGRRRHERAQKPVEKPLAPAPAAKDFPF